MSREVSGEAERTDMAKRKEYDGMIFSNNG